MKKIYFLLLIFSIIFAACKKNRDAELSTFLIQNEKIILSSASVELSCEVVSSATITELYLQYGTKADFSKCEEVRMTEGKSSYSVKIDNLTANTTYYVRYLAVNNYSSMTSEKTSKFKTLTKSEPEEQFEPEYVDLGLSVKWATCNVGATKPEEYGDYFAWGEVEPKEIYNWSTYKYCNGSSKALTKYCSHSSYGNNGFTDGKTILDPEDDAAIANWGGAWRMPTDAELTELREKCKWTWTSQNDVNGYKVVGPNGNSIFLPAAGYKDGESLLITRSFGNYWSNSLHTDYSDLAYSVYFYSDVVDKYGSNRDHGRSVRPVFGERNTNTNKYTISVSSNNSSYGSVSGGGTYEEGTQVILRATAKAGYKFTEWNDGNTDNPRVITVTQDESYTAVFVEKTMKDGHEYVDLGLPSGLKWATCNVGAERLEDYGDYFAWGEVEPKATYNWSTYKYCKGTDKTLTKYCNNSSHGNNGFIDNKTVLDPSDDAAIVNWGGAWRMPTQEEQEELVNNCTWTWTTQNGVNGYKVTGPNGNSIFLPATGYMSDGSLNGVGSYGGYWSSSLNTSNPDYAYRVYFYSSNVLKYGDYRYYGLSVRPVFWERDINNYTISVSSNDSSYGSVSGGGTYAEGTEVTLTATANSGYQFKEWNDGNTDNPRVITVTQDESYTAVFVEKTMSEGYEYVDLGLSVKWATCNIGADSPEDYGDYFAWGEVTTKNSYDWSTYKYCEGSDVTLIKYCTESSYGKDGFVDNKIMLDPTDDAAIVNWGGEWRMPTKAEQDELRDKCTWTWITTENGVSGYRVTSNVLGYTDRSIFLPAAGSKSGSTCENVGTFGSYWSNLLGSYDEQDYIVRFATSISFSSSYKDADGVRDRSYGRSVRPVYGERKYIISVFVNNVSYGNVMGATSAKKGTQVTLKATANSGYQFKEWNDGNTDNPRVITVTQDESYTAHFEVGHEYVDLGLSVKWATCNVGAERPEDYGDYFAWGEVEPKETYDWSTYKYCNGSSSTLTKYCNGRYGNNGFTDNKTVLDPSDDAATVNWGGAWRMPTLEEQKELVNNCTWTWTTQNGVNGYKVVGPNGNSIFLPAAGYMDSSSLSNVGSRGYYWSSSLLTSLSNGAYYVDFYSSDVCWDYYGGRGYGHSVRPICK